MRESILIIADPTDLHTRAVSAVLEKNHGLNVVTFDMADFPMSASSSFRVDLQSEGSISGSFGAFETSEIRSIWWRRPAPCRLPRTDSNIAESFLRSECSHYVQGLLWEIDCLWVNNPHCERRASRKVVQLAYAKKLGFAVPKTLITNNPDDVCKFISESGGKIVYKRTGTSRGMQSKTSFVTDEELSRIDSIRSSPTTFQEYIEAKADLRITWIDGIAWTVRIDSQSGTNPEDSRFDLSVSYTPFELPVSVSRELKNLMRGLGLVYGAIDMRIGIDDRYYFLEVNPSGQFAYVEIKTGMPITACIARLLASGKCRD